MSQRLAGTVAVITGGSSGIGLATAKRFVDEGAYVFITGRRKSELDAAVKQIGRSGRVFRAMSPNWRILTPCMQWLRSRKANSTSFLPTLAPASLHRLVKLRRTISTSSSA